MKPALPPIPAFLRWATGISAVALGLGYLLGPSQYSSSESFFYLHTVPIPFQVWGAAFTLAGVLITFNVLVGYFIAVVSWGFWEGCFVMALATGHLNGWGGVVWPGYFVVMNGFQIWKWSVDRAWKQHELREERLAHPAGPVGGRGRHERSE
jgi:hypothetical protein